MLMTETRTRRRTHPLRRLAEILDWIDTAGQPGSSASAVQIVPGRDRRAESGNPDAARSGWRDLHSTAVSELHNIADKYERKIGREAPKPRGAGFRCGKCGWGCRKQSIYCDGCGALLSETVK